MRKQDLTLLFLFFFSSVCFSQKDTPFLSEFRFDQFHTCRVLDSETKKPIKYVNVGIIEKGEGTVSDENGFFTLRIGDEFIEDVLRVSCLGYDTLDIDIRAFKAFPNDTIYLNERTFYPPAITRPHKYKEKILGNSKKKSFMTLSIKDQDKGFEIGTLLSVKKRAYLKELNISIHNCSYDSVLYRLNVYKQKGENEFENILHTPVYINQKIEKEQKNLVFDLSSYNITIDGKSLITLEHIRDKKEGEMDIYGLLFGEKCYGRETSQDKFEKMAVMKVAMSVKADVEK